MLKLGTGTLPKTKMDPENGTLRDCFPFTNQRFSGSMLVFDGVCSIGS